ncbi:HU family DNA-binding protein [Bergeriella denitrificans]|uniref:DNA-binding protein HU-B n=1 Tax=Bergeriella denitrificans TaxID=494 RepID=A0A378URR5_BERDE|nr:HU family DNA-binding protein [Bergeriella denitrificans]STZ74808.1 DNA-binding protein HU-B [Bergeriella denitrificans]STZ76096.1 DNA-binding protein HU-B [Bergeriella denitrificans]STZ83028.1 DNA-binding protein HU-B [Bergeriella denitrificans]STZ83107.1 DNA-binding protein HU-B [Bergeriella denitrificans]
MNKTELIAAIAEQSGLTKAEATRALQAFECAVIDELAGGGEVALTGFGTFRAVKVEARNGRNPKTGETILLPAHTAPKFKAGKALKDAVNP